MLRLEGKVVAQAQEERVQLEAAKFERLHKIKAKLVVVLVGANPASQVYVKNKELACHRVGLASERIDLPDTVSEEELIKKVQELNQNPTVHGILVQMPLPKQVDTNKVIEAIDPRKDVDGLTTTNLGRLWTGQSKLAPCTPSGVIEMLKHYWIPIARAHAVVVGRSSIVGKPMAQLLLNEQATVTICHSQTPNIEEVTRLGDIVVVAAGKPRLLGASAFKKNAVVIDVGIHRTADGKLCGDVKFEELSNHVKAASPVPGGVGPMTIAMLLHNTMELAKLGQA